MAIVVPEPNDFAGAGEKNYAVTCNLGVHLNQALSETIV